MPHSSPLNFGNPSRRRSPDEVRFTRLHLLFLQRNVKICCLTPVSAKLALRSLVIFRKVCLGSRSRAGAENVAIFSSLAQTAKQQEGKVIDLFQSLFQGSVDRAHDQLFPGTS